MASIFAHSAPRRLLIGTAVLAVLLTAAGCGRRGALEPPPGETSVTPRPVASQRLAAPVAQVTTTDSSDLDDNSNGLLVQEFPKAEAQSRPVAVAPAPADPDRPRKRFLLDPLVN